MAEVISHNHVAFRNRPVNHAPSPLGFGFGLSAPPNNPAWAAASSSLVPWNIPTVNAGHSPNTVRILKRRHENDEDDAARDEAMERSPTPERPKRTIPKRARTTPAAVPSTKDSKSHKGDKADGSDVDVGVLLASLPPDTLLPLLTALITSQPSLKPVVLSLIPRPTLATAIDALMKSSRKLLDAFPYSSSSNFASPSSASFSLSAGAFGGPRSPSTTRTSAFGFSRSPTPFGSANDSPPSGMREEYVVSRLRPHIHEFVSACFSYLPYFSYVDNLSLTDSEKSHAVPHAESHASALQTQHRDKSHPSETYLFLEALTAQMLSQPPLTQANLIPMLIPRLAAEWRAWVDRVDYVVNREGRMFGQEAVHNWERRLDEFAQAKGNGIEVMRDIRDRWVSKVGWLVGRQPMEES